MLTLSVKIRKISGRKTKSLRKKGVLPAVLYGPKIKPLPLEVDLKEFEKIHQQAGESSLISLKMESMPEELPPVLIQDIQKNKVTDQPIHIDFYQVPLEGEIEVKIPLVFIGEPPAVKDLGGTLVKNIQEVIVKALPKNLPREIEADVGNLKTFEDKLLVKDLKAPAAVKLQRNLGEIVAWVSPLEKVEEELEKPLEEKVEEVEKVEKKPKEEPETKAEAEGKQEKA